MEYLHLPEIIEAFAKLDMSDPKAAKDKIHNIGPRCKWCTDGLTLALLVDVYRRLEKLEKK